jgi:hypothetical protein
MKMNRALELAWLMKAALAALSTLLLCAGITLVFASSPQIQVSENDGEAASALIDYGTQPIPDRVLLGTSLAYRLKEQFFLPLNIRTLAIPGRSPLTGLTIVASYPKLPANIFIETNVMVWNADNDFVKKFSYNSDPHFEIVPPVRSLVAYLNSPSKKPPNETPHVDETILKQPPAQYDNKIYLERGKKEWSGHTQDANISSNTDALARLVETVEARGSTVYFFELPLAPGMAETDVARTTRAALHQRFTDPSRWLSLNYPVDQLRFGDHAHLDERSALVVARAMEAALLPLTGGRIAAQGSEEIQDRR